MLKFKKALALCLALGISFTGISSSFACTGVIVGKDLTTDGSFIFGRTEDYERNRTKRLVVHPAGEFKKGEKLVDVNNGFEFIHPEDSYKFSSTPDSYNKPEDMEAGVYDAAGFNEKGLAAFCTVSADYSDEIDAVDPYVDKGTNEASMTTVVLAHAKTARKAVELMAKLIDEKGASMGDVVTFGDKNEVWYMEIYSGHQYCAIKYPDDKFSVFPNAFWLGGVDLNDKENVIHSKDIVTVAKKAGTYKETSDGLMDLAASYNPKKLSNGVRSRVWSGIHALDSNSKIAYDAEDFPLLNELSDKKIDIKDVLALMRNRMENTDMKVTDNKKLFKKTNEYKYPIGNIWTMQAHIFQLKPNYPIEAPGIMWLTPGSPLNIPFVPVFADINDTHEAYKNDSPKYSSNSFYWVGSAVNDMVTSDRNRFGKQMREKVLKFEDKEMKQLPALEQKWLDAYKTDKAEASKISTQITMNYCDEAFKLEKQMKDDLSAMTGFYTFDSWNNNSVLKSMK